LAKKLHWKTKAKREIDRWEKQLQTAGRKNRWSTSKSEYTEKHGKELWELENKRRRGLEKYWKSQRDKKRYQVEKLKDKLNPLRIKKRNEKRQKVKMKDIAKGS